MKKININLTSLIFAVIFMAFTGILTSCGGDELSPGVEYMPDMYRSPSIEPYVDYADYGYPDSLSARKPVEGTIPRGHYRPYNYPNTNEGYEMAGENLVNPIALNEKTLAEGKELYTYFCQHCHGKKGDGKGSISHPVYGAVPSYADTTPNRRGGRAMSDLKPGHIYHTIMYGLNAMGPHASQINVEERWKIIHYVHTLQKSGKEESDASPADDTTSESDTVAVSN